MGKNLSFTTDTVLASHSRQHVRDPLRVELLDENQTYLQLITGPASRTLRLSSMEPSQSPEHVICLPSLPKPVLARPENSRSIALLRISKLYELG